MIASSAHIDAPRRTVASTDAPHSQSVRHVSRWPAADASMGAVRPSLPFASTATPRVCVNGSCDRPVAGGARDWSALSPASPRAAMLAPREAARALPRADCAPRLERRPCRARGVEVALRRGGVHPRRQSSSDCVLAQQRQQFARERQFARRPSPPCEHRLQRHGKFARERPARLAAPAYAWSGAGGVGAFLDREEVARLEARRGGGRREHLADAADVSTARRSAAAAGGAGDGDRGHDCELERRRRLPRRSSRRPPTNNLSLTRSAYLRDASRRLPASLSAPRQSRISFAANVSSPTRPTRAIRRRSAWGASGSVQQGGSSGWTSRARCSGSGATWRSRDDRRVGGFAGRRQRDARRPRRQARLVLLGSRSAGSGGGEQRGSGRRRRCRVAHAGASPAGGELARLVARVRALRHLAARRRGGRRRRRRRRWSRCARMCTAEEQAASGAPRPPPSSSRRATAAGGSGRRSCRRAARGSASPRGAGLPVHTVVERADGTVVQWVASVSSEYSISVTLQRAIKGSTFTVRRPGAYRLFAERGGVGAVGGDGGRAPLVHHPRWDQLGHPANYSPLTAGGYPSRSRRRDRAPFSARHVPSRRHIRRWHRLRGGG